MICTRCKKDKSEDNFYSRKNRNKKFSSWCKSCLKEHRDKYAEKARIVRRLRTYNITEEELTELYKKQKHRCGICGIKESDTKKKSLCVDHDHKTGKVRGLLCDDCNVGIARLKDNIDILNNAIKYLNI